MGNHDAMVHLCVGESASELEARSVWRVYESVFDDYPSYAAWFEGMWGPHSGRDGFRLVRAFDGDDLVGFAWGYTGRRGQWWTDQARTVLDPEVADVWLDGHFELVSIGVVGGARGSGTGRGLLRALPDGLTHERFLLMTTSDAVDPARRLYAKEGWLVVGPGIGDGTVIMAGRTPDRLWLPACVASQPSRSFSASASVDVTGRSQTNPRHT